MPQITNGKPVDAPVMPPGVELEVHITSERDYIYLRLVDYKNKCVLDSMVIPAVQILKAEHGHTALMREIDYYKALLKDHGVY